VTAEVLAQGEDGGRRGPGRTVGAVVALALLGGLAVAAVRARDPEPAARPSPTPSPPRTTSFTSYAGPGVFDEATTLDMPDVSGDPVPVRLDDGAGVFLLSGVGALPRVLAAHGGPSYAPVRVGWCAPERTFRDEEGAFVYDEEGRQVDGEGLLARHEIRNSPTRGRVEVAHPGERLGLEPTVKPAAGPCPVPLVYPPLPDDVRDVHATGGGYRVVPGRYVVTTVTRRFCATGTHPRCLAGGWEDYGRGLPYDDVAGAYVWEGRFLAHADPDTGHLDAIRLPGGRLVARDRVGARVARGIAVLSSLRSGSAVLSMERFTGDGALAKDRYTVPASAEIHVPGRTGIGRPRGTPEMLHDFVLSRGSAEVAIVSDRAGRVIRVVVERAR
jgi:hypothetical protein